MHDEDSLAQDFRQGEWYQELRTDHEVLVGLLAKLDRRKCHTVLCVDFGSNREKSMLGLVRVLLLQLWLRRLWHDEVAADYIVSVAHGTQSKLQRLVFALSLDHQIEFPWTGPVPVRTNGIVCASAESGDLPENRMEVSLSCSTQDLREETLVEDVFWSSWLKSLV